MLNGFKFSPDNLVVYSCYVTLRTMALDHNSFVDGYFACCFPSRIKTAPEPLMSLVSFPHFILSSIVLTVIHAGFGSGTETNHA